MIYRVKSYAGSFGSNNMLQDYHYHSLTQDPGFSSQNVELYFDQGEFNDVYRLRNQKGMGKSIFSFRSSFRFISVKEAMKRNIPFCFVWMNLRALEKWKLRMLFVS